jgi:SAM-dependent methyltransferase
MARAAPGRNRRRSGTRDRAARHRSAWEDWADVDPLWAVLTDPDGQHGRWDLERFFALGRDTVDAMLSRAASLGRPVVRCAALDFGCGVGRLTVALAAHFEHTVGLDIASGMVDEANRLDGGRSGARFRVHEGDDLGGYESGSVDLVSCLLVLQHLPSRAGIERYLQEFVRVLSPGGIAVVQLPVHVPRPPETRRGRFALRRRVTGALRAVGVSRRFLYERLGWRPEMHMTAIPQDETIAVFERAGGVVLYVDPPSPDEGGVESCFYYVAPAAAAASR